MSIEDNKALVRRFLGEAWNRRNLDRVDALARWSISAIPRWCCRS